MIPLVNLRTGKELRVADEAGVTFWEARGYARRPQEAAKPAKKTTSAKRADKPSK